MRIAVFENLPLGGARRVSFEVGRRLASRHEIDLFRLDIFQENAMDLAAVARQVHLLRYSPAFGLLDERLGMYQKAQQEMLLSLKIDPNQDDARNTLGVIYAEQGNYERAHEEWADLIKSHPDYAPARANMAILNRIERGEIAAVLQSHDHRRVRGAPEGLHHLLDVAPHLGLEAGLAPVEGPDDGPLAAGEALPLADAHALEAVGDARAGRVPAHGTAPRYSRRQEKQARNHRNGAGVGGARRYGGAVDHDGRE